MFLAPGCEGQLVSYLQAEAFEHFYLLCAHNQYIKRKGKFIKEHRPHLLRHETQEKDEVPDIIMQFLYYYSATKRHLEHVAIFLRYIQD